MITNQSNCFTLFVLKLGGDTSTGTYLRMDGKDFQVCNIGKLSLFSTGTAVNATFRKIDNCKRLEDKVICKMLHPNEGLIEIVKLK